MGLAVPIEPIGMTGNEEIHLSDIFVLFWWCVLGISMYNDRSRYRNTAFLALALLNSFSLLLIPLRSGSVAVVFILFLAAMLLIMMAPFMLIANGVVIGVSVIYGSVVFAAFAIYTLFLQVIPVKRDFDYVIVHGSGLINGSRVSKLLSDRIGWAIVILPFVLMYLLQ